jgi:cytochrome b involved in lipid metabolism
VDRTDCWIAVKGLVYNVTPYLKEHPGGVGAIVMNGGKDATEDFEVGKSIFGFRILKN